MRRLLLLLSVTLVVSLSAACGDDGSDSESATTADDTTTSTTAADDGDGSPTSTPSGGDCVANGAVQGGPGTTFDDTPAEAGIGASGKPFFIVNIDDGDLSIGYSSDGESLNAQLVAGSGVWIGFPDHGGTYEVRDDGLGAKVQAPLRDDFGGPDIQLDVTITC